MRTGLRLRAAGTHGWEPPNFQISKGPFSATRGMGMEYKVAAVVEADRAKPESS